MDIRHPIAAKGPPSNRTAGRRAHAGMVAFTFSRAALILRWSARPRGGPSTASPRARGCRLRTTRTCGPAVVAQEDHRRVLGAAEELVRYVEKATGARLQIVVSAPAAAPRILAGSAVCPTGVRDHLRRFHGDACLIRTLPDGPLALDFLEPFAGVRTDLGKNRAPLTLAIPRPYSRTLDVGHGGGGGAVDCRMTSEGGKTTFAGLKRTGSAMLSSNRRAASRPRVSRSQLTVVRNA